MPPPRPWAAPVSEPALRRYQQEWPVQYHKPITRSGQPRAGRVARGRSTCSLGKPKLQAAQPSASGNQLHPTPAPPVHPAKALRRRPWAESIPPTCRQLLLKRPCVTGQCALMTPRPNTKESSLQSISPMFGSAVQERAMAGVTQGHKSCSCMPVDGITLLPRIPVAWHKAGILRTSPGLHDVGYYYDQANLASFLHRLVKSSICRANSFYYILILFSLLSLCFDSFISSSHRCVSRERKAHFWRVLALVASTIPHFWVCIFRYWYMIAIIWEP